MLLLVGVFVVWDYSSSIAMCRLRARSCNNRSRSSCVYQSDEGAWGGGSVCERDCLKNVANSKSNASMRLPMELIKMSHAFSLVDFSCIRACIRANAA